MARGVSVVHAGCELLRKSLAEDDRCIRPRPVPPKRLPIVTGSASGNVGTTLSTSCRWHDLDPVSLAGEVRGTLGQASWRDFPPVSSAGKVREKFGLISWHGFHPVFSARGVPGTLGLSSTTGNPEKLEEDEDRETLRGGR